MPATRHQTAETTRPTHPKYTHVLARSMQFLLRVFPMQLTISFPDRLSKLSDHPCQSRKNMRIKIFRDCKLLTIPWVVCVLFVLGGCSILPGHWRPGWNQQWPMGKPVPDTAGSWKLTELESKDDRFVALSISGGGSRAANFGAAVMLELRQRGLLEQVDVISGVSGGTLPACTTDSETRQAHVPSAQ